jgi:hypothetical protein
MKNIILTALASIILISSACKKINATSGGTWSFKSTTYNASFCSYVSGALTASTETATPSGSLAFYFSDSFPPQLNSYIVTNVFPPSPGYVFVQLTDTSIANSYVVTGSNPVTVTVTKGAKGYVTATLPPVEMYNVNNSVSLGSQITIGYPTHTDSSLVTGKVTQTQ